MHLVSSSFAYGFVFHFHRLRRLSKRTIGGRAPQFPDVETARMVSVDYTLAAAKTFLTELAPQLSPGQKFRFVFCSGKYAEWDDTKHLSFMSDTRHIKVGCTPFSTHTIFFKRHSGIMLKVYNFLSRVKLRRVSVSSPMPTKTSSKF